MIKLIDDVELSASAMTERETGETALVLKGVSMKGKVAGLMLDMQVTQRYKNVRRKEIETVYTFPVPYRATLLDIEMKIGDEILKGAIAEKYSARKNYEESVEKGDLPVLVEQTGSGLCTANIGNIKPGEEIEVTVRYAALLDVDQGRIRLGVPTALAPRYGDPASQGGLASHECVTSNILAEYPLSLEIELFGDVAMGRVFSPTNRIGLGMVKGGGIRVTLEDGRLDRDFVLSIEDVPFEGASACGEYKNEFSAISSFMPKIDAGKGAKANIKVLVDCSGSMCGARIASAIRALSSLVDALGASDKMSLSCFGSNHVNFHESTKCCNAARKANLRSLISRIGADMGGTEMQAALCSVINDVAKGGAEYADILLITDGEVWAADEMKTIALTSGHRIYTIGVGAAPNEQMLRAMSEGSGGMSRIVSDGEDMSQAVFELVAAMRQEFASNVRIDWHAEPLWQSPLPKAIFGGLAVHAFARFEKAPEVPPTLSFTLAGKSYSFDAAGPERFPGDALSRFAGASEHRDLVAGYEYDKAREAALKYGVVTEDTSLYLVKIRAEGEKASGMPVLEEIAQMMPADEMGCSPELMERMGNGRCLYQCIDLMCSFSEDIDRDFIDPMVCGDKVSCGNADESDDNCKCLIINDGREDDFFALVRTSAAAQDAEAKVSWGDLEACKRLEESGDADDMFALFACYALIDEDAEQALSWLARAADKDHKDALSIILTLIRRRICKGENGYDTKALIKKAAALGITPL